MAWLNFDGINWKAEVYLNGEKLGRIEGGFMRGRFDVTGKLIAGGANALAVRIEKNATPGSVKQKTFETPGKNGGALGADNPTYHASIGWDWIPTIRGRNTGIWGDVYLTETGPVTIENPFVTTTLPLPDTSQRRCQRSKSTWRIIVPQPVSGVLRGRFGEVHFEQRVTLAASERQEDQARSHDTSRTAPQESQALVASRLWRAASLRRRIDVRSRRTRQSPTPNRSRPACAS